jgi:hypothetical protein
LANTDVRSRHSMHVITWYAKRTMLFTNLDSF